MIILRSDLLVGQASQVLLLMDGWMDVIWTDLWGKKCFFFFFIEIKILTAHYFTNVNIVTQKHLKSHHH